MKKWINKRIWRTLEMLALCGVSRPHEYDLDGAVSAPLLALWQIHAKVICFRKLGDSCLNFHNTRAPELISPQNCHKNPE